MHLWIRNSTVFDYLCCKQKKANMYIDTHAHLYAAAFDEDRKEMLQRARDAGVERIYLPNIDVTSVGVMHDLEAQSEGYCIPMMGLHPCSVNEDYREALAQLRPWLDKRPYAAIGEIGIDLYWDKSTFAYQVEAFEEQLRWGNQYRLPVSIHSRDSTREVIDVMQANRRILTGGVMHCFTGTVEEAMEVIDLGFFLGFGGSSTYKNTTLIPVIEQIPLGSIVLETDAPYLTPVPHRGKRNESAYIPLIAERIAAIRNIPVEEVARETSNNARQLFAPKHIEAGV